MYLNCWGMKQKYKRLGDYIRQVDVRNRDLAVDKLLGLSVNKQFIPSIANTVGTDMSNYKVVAPNQFVYIADTSRRGDKIAIALLGGQDKAIVSAIYTVFEIIIKTELLPEYLMMWFRRPEFDRYARFKSHGSAREVFEWEEMCEVIIPVPPIEEQRKIVAEYQAIERRIENNRRLIATLEEAAKAIYRKMFVEDIDPENLPEGWRMGKLGEIARIKAGGDKPKLFSDNCTDQYRIPVIANGIENMGVVGYTLYPVIKDAAITISARGTIGVCFIRTEPYCPIVRLISVIPHDESFLYYLFFQLSSKQFKGDGSVQNQLTIPNIEREEVVTPNVQMVDEFNKKFLLIKNTIELKIRENSVLTELQSLLFSKLGLSESNNNY